MSKLDNNIKIAGHNVPLSTYDYDMANIHLLILVHGMWGTPSHVGELERIVKETHTTNDGISLHVHTAQSIRAESTYDGIDWCGERVAKEVSSRIMSKTIRS